MQGQKASLSRDAAHIHPPGEEAYVDREAGEH
jgi:hypothetical protein